MRVRKRRVREKQRKIEAEKWNVSFALIVARNKVYMSHSFDLPAPAE